MVMLHEVDGNETVLLSIIYILISQASYSSAYSISVYISSHAFIDPVENVESSGLGTGFRTVICPSETGIYIDGIYYSDCASSNN